MSSVHAIIVTYHPDVTVLKGNISNLLACGVVAMVHIVDNTPAGMFNFEPDYESVSVISLGENKGIAYAQNVGIQRAKDFGAKYVALFDQDSTLSVDLVPNLLKTMMLAEMSGVRLACLGPRPLDVFTGRIHAPLVQSERGISEQITICRQIIASGKLIKVSTLDVIGLMDVSLFIDGVDHEWCWRAKKHGFLTGIAENAVMPHKLGDSRERFFFFTYKVGAPVRLYYQFRNALILSRRTYVPLYWKFRTLLGCVVRFFIFSFGVHSSAERRKYMIDGFLDGIKNKSGPYL